MINPYSSDVVASQQLVTLNSGEPAQALILVNNNVLVISADGLALFKDLASITDPLASGLLDSMILPNGLQLEQQQGQFVMHYQAGFVALHNDYSILLTPNNVRLYANKQDALSNKNQIDQLEFVQ